MPLAVSVAAHSALMASAIEEFAARVAATPFRVPAIRVIGNVKAEALTTPEEIRDELVSQLTSPVRWTASVIRMVADGAKRFIEIGPGNVLTGLIKRIDPNVETANIATPEDVARY
jgi:[acyl-carrier-protein] S-malonyltransferase